jgi:hypothetical protein
MEQSLKTLFLVSAGRNRRLPINSLLEVLPRGNRMFSGGYNCLVSHPYTPFCLAVGFSVIKCTG